MSIGPMSTLVDLAYEVCTALDLNGITAVLSGGGAATVYAPDAYQSRDLDFILQLSATDGLPNDQPLRDIGFNQRDRSGIYSHALVVFTLEFPPGPLAIGAEIITQWQTLHREETALLHIITPTDSVRDRLAAAIHWNDFMSIRQAVAVAARHEVDLNVIESWCDSEGGARQFRSFIDALRKAAS